MTLNKDTFTGEYQYSLDSKGRVNIPAKFRQSLSKKNQNTFVATRGQDPCIWVYPLTEWKKIEDECEIYRQFLVFIELLLGRSLGLLPLPHAISRTDYN